MKAKKYEGLTCELAVFIKAYGGNYLRFNSTSNVKAFEFLQNLSDYLHPNSNIWNEGTIPGSISTGEIYINFNWPYQVAVLEKKGLAEKIKVFPTPLGPVGRGTVVGGGFLAISKASPNKDLAWEFVKFLASKRGQGLQLHHVGWLPIRDDAWDYLHEIDPGGYMNLMSYRETIRYGLARPAIQNYSELTELWQDAFWEIVWEGKPASILDHYQSIWELKQGK
jgi:ABC-type glycerol-3-phosphate transport system substrate-binding protein